MFSPSARPPARPCFRRLSRVFAVRPVFSPSFPCFRRRSQSFAVFRRLSPYFDILHNISHIFRCMELHSASQRTRSKPSTPAHARTYARMHSIPGGSVQCSCPMCKPSNAAKFPSTFQALSLEFRGIQNARSTVHAQFARGPSTDMCSLCQSQRQAHTVFKIRLGGSAWQAIAL